MKFYEITEVMEIIDEPSDKGGFAEIAQNWRKTRCHNFCHITHAHLQL